MIFCSKIKIDSIKQTKVPFLHQLIASWPTSGPPGGKWWLCLLELSLHPLLLQQEQRKAQIILTLRKIFYMILILATISSLDKTDPGVISSSYTSYGMGDCLTLCSRLTEVVFTLTFTFCTQLISVVHYGYVSLMKGRKWFPHHTALPIVSFVLLSAVDKECVWWIKWPAKFPWGWILYDYVLHCVV